MRDLSLSKAAAVALVLVLGVFSFTASAQNRKPKPKPLATPPVLTGAEIISQSGDYIDPQPTPVEKVPEKRPSTTSARLAELTDRVNKLESQKKVEYDDKQRRLLLNLDILTRAEQRTESLRKQLFEMIEKENTIKTRLDQIDYDSRPEVIERMLQIAGSMRPEEVRDNRRKTLDAERRNLSSLLTQIQNTHASLDAALQRAELMVDKLRERLEKDIDNALLKDEPTDQ